jgi:hypothetical protein
MSHTEPPSPVLLRRAGHHVEARATRRSGPRSRRLALLARALACAAALLFPQTVSAQGTGTGSGMRVGFSVGGISTVGVTLEFFHEQESLVLDVGTWSFHDVSLSVTGREYFGAGYLHPFVGAGLWLVLARPPGGRFGMATVLQAPVGLDWRVVGPHYVGAVINVDRALWVRRTDPQDDLPLNKRIVPLPGLYYRWRN